MSSHGTGTGMRILFMSELVGNRGPANVNRELVAHWPAEDEVITVRSSNKVLRALEAVAKGLRCDLVVSATGGSLVELVACRVLAAAGRPYVAFVHGYVPYENALNRSGMSERRMRAYERYLRRAEAVVANSELQMRHVAEYQPELEGRLRFIDNAVEPFEQRLWCGHAEGSRPVVAVSGGTRPIKGNDVVVRAVELNAARGLACEMWAFGIAREDQADMAGYVASGTCALRGQVPHEEFLAELNRADVFVMNSRHEPFGLSALDAIEAGCSVLLSRNCGVLGVLQTREEDVVEDCEDAEEVARKIAWLIDHPNGRCLYEGIDFDTLNWDVQTRKLREICVNSLHVQKGAADFDALFACYRIRIRQTSGDDNEMSCTPASFYFLSLLMFVLAVAAIICLVFGQEVLSALLLALVGVMAVAYTAYTNKSVKYLQNELVNYTIPKSANRRRVMEDTFKECSLDICDPSTIDALIQCAEFRARPHRSWMKAMSGCLSTAIAAAALFFSFFSGGYELLVPAALVICLLFIIFDVVPKGIEWLMGYSKDLDEFIYDLHQLKLKQVDEAPTAGDAAQADDLTPGVGGLPED